MSIETLQPTHHETSKGAEGANPPPAEIIFNLPEALPVSSEEVQASGGAVVYRPYKGRHPASETPQSMEPITPPEETPRQRIAFDETAFRPIEQLSAPDLPRKDSKAPVPQLRAGERTPHAPQPEIAPQPPASDSRKLAVSALAKAVVRAVELDGPFTVTRKELSPAITERLITYQLTGLNEIGRLESEDEATALEKTQIEQQIKEIREDLEAINEKRGAYSDEGLQREVEKLLTESTASDNKKSPSSHLLKNTGHELRLIPQRRSTWQRIKKRWSAKFNYTIGTLDQIANLEFSPKHKNPSTGKHPNPAALKQKGKHRRKK